MAEYTTFLNTGIIGEVPTTTTTNSNFYVNPDISSVDAAQSTMSNLIEQRYSFLKEKTTPLEDALFSYSAYNNPNLLQETTASAIPLVQQAYGTERDVTNRAMASMGMQFDSTESKLRDKLQNLTSQESIANAASTIRNKIRDRELQIAYGTAAGYSNTVGQAS